MPDPARKAMAVFCMVIFPTAYLFLVWNICMAAAEGSQVDWKFTAYLLVFFGIIMFFAVGAFATILSNPSLNQEKPNTVIEPTVVVTPPPAPKPLLRRNEQTQLVGALLAGLLGGLLVLLFLKKRSK